MAQSSEDSANCTVTDMSEGSPSNNEMCFTPYTVIVENLPTPKCETYAPLGEFLRDYLDVDVNHVVSYWKKPTVSGHAVVEIENSPAAFKAAMHLHKAFQITAHGKLDWQLVGEKNGPYVWLATPDDDIWLDPFTDKYTPCIVPQRWKVQAAATAARDAAAVYRGVNLYTGRFVYAQACSNFHVNRFCC